MNNIKKIAILIFLNIMILPCVSQTLKAKSDLRDINQKYLDANIARIKIFNNNKLLKEKIIKILKRKEHTHRVSNDSIYSINEDYSQISELSLYQNKVIYLMLINLKDTTFLNRIGQIIKEDVEDIYSEIGGIIKFTKSGKIYLKCFKSDMESEHNEDYNDTYYFPQKEDSFPKIAYFHMHAAIYNETPYAGPSSWDIMHALYPYKLNMVNEFVITSLEKGKFNVDYYGTDIRAGEHVNNIIDGLLYKGNDIKQVNVIDLGNYYYKTK
jgi:hypothetical protein